MKWSDIQRVRLGIERTLTRALVRRTKCRVGQAGESAIEERRRAWIADAVLLSRASARDAYGIFDAAARALALDVPFDLYQRSGEFNACVDPWLEGRVLISLIGPALSMTDPAGLQYIAGHEFGHHLAHGASAWMGVDPAAAFRDPGLDSEARRLARALSHAGELTCDRFGLLACYDLDAALRSNVLTAVGQPTASLGLDVRAYLEDCRAVIERTLERGEVARGSSHPEHSLRAYALWLFSESDLYAELTGRGSGSRSIKEIDDTLRQLLGIGDAGLTPMTTPPEAPKEEVLPAPIPAAPIADSLWEIADPIVRAAKPGISRGIDWIRGRLAMGPWKPNDPNVELEPLDNDLERRFEELERRMGANSADEENLRPATHAVSETALSR